MTSADDIKELPISLDQDRDAIEATARARDVAQQFYSAQDGRMAENHGIARDYGREESDIDARDTLKTAVWLYSQHNARVAGLRTRFSFKTA